MVWWCGIVDANLLQMDHKCSLQRKSWLHSSGLYRPWLSSQHHQASRLRACLVMMVYRQTVVSPVRQMDRNGAIDVCMCCRRRHRQNRRHHPYLEYHLYCRHHHHTQLAVVQPQGPTWCCHLMDHRCSRPIRHRLLRWWWEWWCCQSWMASCR